MNTGEQYLEHLLENEIIVDFNEILLYNDDFNTFEHVIEMLCKYCEHDPVQAEQCAWIVHNNGKCILADFWTLKFYSNYLEFKIFVISRRLNQPCCEMMLPLHFKV